MRPLYSCTLCSMVARGDLLCCL